MPRFVFLNSILTALGVLLTPTAFAYDESLAQQCITDMCGPAESYLPMEGRGVLEKVVPRDVERFLKRKIDPLLEELTKQSLRKLRFQLDAIKKFKTEGSSFNVKQQAFLNFQTISLIVYPHQNEIFYRGPDDQLKLNPNQLVKFYPQIAFSQAKKIASAMNGYFASDAYLYVLMRTSSVERYLKIEYAIYIRESENNKLSYEEFKKKRLVAALSLAKSFNEALGFDLFVNEDLRMVESLINNKRLNRFEEERVSYTLAGVLQLTYVLDDDVAKDFVSIDLSVDQILDLNKFSKVQNVFDSHSEYKFTLKKQEVFNYCHKKIVRYLSLVPSELTMRRAKDLFERVKMEAKDAIPLYLSENKAEAAIQGINSLIMRSEDFRAPKNYLNEFLIYRANRVKEEIRNISEKQNASKYAFALTHIILNNDYDAKENNVIEDYFLDIRMACNHIRPDVFTDHYMFYGNEIQVSAASKIFSELGIQVMAHELGHAVSAFGSYKTDEASSSYTKMRQCSEEKHKELLAGKEIDIPADRYVEEDWADDFALIISKRLQNQLLMKNKGCVLFDLSKDGKQRLNTAIDQESPAAFHSSDIFRAIKFHTGLGKTLPQSCKKMLGPELEKIVTRSCLPEVKP